VHVGNQPCPQDEDEANDASFRENPSEHEGRVRNDDGRRQTGL
jgi:hypothetical protein